jgi:hypothetical protein
MPKVAVKWAIQGQLFFDTEAIEVIDTKKENDLIIHFTKKLPTILKQK